jgi:hypothetical protein
MYLLARLDRVVVDVLPSDARVGQGRRPDADRHRQEGRQTDPERNDLENPTTFKRLGYRPITLDDGLAQTLEWFRAVGMVDPVYLSTQSSSGTRRISSAKPSLVACRMSGIDGAKCSHGMSMISARVKFSRSSSPSRG